jgi:hypothetical protein
VISSKKIEIKNALKIAVLHWDDHRDLEERRVLHCQRMSLLVRCILHMNNILAHIGLFCGVTA